MKLITLNCRVWTRDRDKESEHYWRTRMEKIRDFIRTEKPDILCLQELSFPASRFIPSTYRRVGISISHHIYVRRDIKANSLGWHIFHNSADVEGILVTNVHGTWNKYMKRVFSQLQKRRVEPAIIVGDFNQVEPDVETKIGMTVRHQLGLQLYNTFSHYSKKMRYTPDHAVVFGITPTKYSIVDDGYAMSDHLPIIIEW